MCIMLTSPAAKLSPTGDISGLKSGQVSEKVDRMGGYEPPDHAPKPLPIPPPHGLRSTNTLAPVYFRSQSDQWATPRALVAALSEELGPFELDVCASAENACAPRYFTVEQDGLAQMWSGVVWMNPPYGRGMGRWVEKAAASVREGACVRVVCVVPARTDTRWWQVIRREASLVRFLPGRVKFGDGRGSAPFPSAVVVFDRTAWPSLTPVGWVP
jgi:phage N-6-adenine-methyltransferase